MEVCHTIIVFINILPDCHCMVMFTVKGTVYKLYLRNLIVYKKLQLFLYCLCISETQFLINGRKTVTAGERTSSAAFIINDPVLKLRQIFVNERNTA